MAQLTVDELIEKIAAAYDSLPRQLKRIATYIEQHRGRVMMDRVGDIAEACNVHPSAVVRFAKHFGFSGFSELQAIFRRAYTEQVAPVQSYQQRVRKLIKSNRGRLRGSEIAREFIDGSRQGLEALGRRASTQMLLMRRWSCSSRRRRFTSPGCVVRLPRPPISLTPYSTLASR